MKYIKILKMMMNMKVIIVYLNGSSENLFLIMAILMWPIHAIVNIITSDMKESYSLHAGDS